MIGKSSTPAIRVRDLRKTFTSGRTTHLALDGVALDVAPGEMVGLIGPSGSGKSTLLRHLTGLTRSDARSSLVEVFGKTVQEAGRLSPDLRRTRRDIGFIFQQFNLVDRLSLLTNVLIGRLAHIPFYRRYVGRFTVAEIQQAMTALDRVGIGAHAGQRAGTLSGGQQQRAAIARAMVQRARLILADEPIASLDPEASRRVMEALRALNRQDGATVVVCLHQVEFAKKFCHRIVALKAGKVVFDGAPADLGLDLLTTIYGDEANDAGIPRADDLRGESDVPHAALMRAGMA